MLENMSAPHQTREPARFTDFERPLRSNQDGMDDLGEKDMNDHRKKPLQKPWSYFKNHGLFHPNFARVTSNKTKHFPRFTDSSVRPRGSASGGSRRPGDDSGRSFSGGKRNVLRVIWMVRFVPSELHWFKS